MKSLKEEEERAASQSEPDDMLTIWNEDVSQVKNRSNRSRINSKCKANVSSATRRSQPGRPNVGRKSSKDKTETVVEPTKRSYRSRQSLNYAKINQGVSDLKTNSRPRGNPTVLSPTSSNKRRSVRFPVKSETKLTPNRRRSRRTSE